jgi:hypothetical protein
MNACKALSLRARTQLDAFLLFLVFKRNLLSSTLFFFFFAQLHLRMRKREISQMNHNTFVSVSKSRLLKSVVKTKTSRWQFFVN